MNDLTNSVGAVGKLIPTAKLVALAVFIGGLVGAIGGAWIAYDYATTKGDAALSKLERQYAVDVANATQAALDQYQAAADRAAKADRALAEAKQRHAAEKQSLLRRIPDVTTVYQAAPGALPVALPRCVFTAGWLSAYNAAIGVPGMQAPAASGKPGAAPFAGAGINAWLRDSGLSQADILAHASDYGERCRGLEDQVNGLLYIYEDKESP